MPFELSGLSHAGLGSEAKLSSMAFLGGRGHLNGEEPQLGCLR